MDTLLSLRVFAAVAEHKSFVEASKRLALSAAMTSKHVQHIEAKVGARLLNRNSRNVSLTEAGAHYLATVRPLLEGLGEAEAHLSQTTMAAKGILRVSLPVWVANASFARVIAAYHEKNPDVILDLDLSGRKINLVEEGVDLALRVATTLDDTLIARELTKVNFHLVASPAFLKKHGRPTSVEALTDAPFLVYSQIGSTGRISFGQGDDAFDIKTKPILISGNETLILHGVREGMGYAFLPHWLTTDAIANEELVLVLPEANWPVLPLYAIYPDRSYLPAKVRSFLDFLAGPEGLDSRVEKP